MQKFKELQLETTREVSDGPLSATLMTVTGASAVFPTGDVLAIVGVGVASAVMGGIAGGPKGAVIAGAIGVVGTATVAAATNPNIVSASNASFSTMTEAERNAFVHCPCEKKIDKLSDTRICCICRYAIIFLRGK